MLENSVLAVAAAAVLALGCGRSGLEPLPYPLEAGGHEPDGGAPDATADGPLDAPEEAIVDASDEPEASPCGAPWVLFGYAAATDGGAGEEYKIYARRADGTEGHTLALPEHEAILPAVSPDGTELLYSNASRSALYLYRFSDRTNRVLGTQGGVGQGAVSPDGRTVVFSDEQNIYLVSTSETGTEEPLVVVPQPNAAGSPVFTSDSQTVIFCATNVVQSIHVDGTGLTTLLEESGGPFPAPTLSPSYDELAAIVSCGGPLQLRAYDVASLPATCTSGRVVATLPPAPVPVGPSWGPEGLVAYSDGRDVLLVSASGSSSYVLTADLTSRTASATDPTWAPACALLP